MIDLLSHVGGLAMFVGIALMALPVIRAAPWGYTPLFEAGLAIFLIGVVVAMMGAIGWILGGGFALTLLRYPLSGA